MWCNLGMCLTEVLNGCPDGREHAGKVRKLNPHVGLVSRAVRLFLWHRYQYDGEGLPDRFSFETDGTATFAKGQPLSVD